MRVFVTGASGFIGSAVVRELLAHGHQVLGLARSDASAKALLDAGAEVLRGDMQDLESLKKGASTTDGVIHLAFIHDFNDYAKAAEIDRIAIETIGNVLEGTNRPFIMTTGTLVHHQGTIAYEDSEVNKSFPRAETEQLVHTYALRGVRTATVRLAPSVHDLGDHMFILMMANAAKKNGAMYYVDEGKNRWPAIHRLDAAVLYRLALEKAPADTYLHGVADESIEFRKIAEIIAKHAGVPVKSTTKEEVMNAFGFVGLAVCADNPVSSKKSRELLGWKPTHLSLLEDIDRPEYYQA